MFILFFYFCLHLHYIIIIYNLISLILFDLTEILIGKGQQLQIAITLEILHRIISTICREHKGYGF